MKLNIKNFGPIKKGEIDLDKRFYVFTGYNNSGKTYVAQLFWSMFSILREKDIFGIYLTDDIIDSKKTPNIFSYDIDIDEVLSTYTTYFKDYIIPSYFNVPNNHSLVTKSSFILKKEISESVSRREIQFLVFKKVNEYNDIDDYYVVRKKQDSLLIEIIYEKTSDANRHYSFSNFKNLEESNLFAHIIIYDEKINKKHLEQAFQNIIYVLISEGAFFLKRFFLPANRIFYPSFYKYIYSVSKEEKDEIDRVLKNGGDIEQIRSLSKRPYTRAMDDIIENVYQLNNNSTENRYYTDLLLELQELMGGEVVAEKSNGIAPIEFSVKLNEKEKLDMYLASSASNQLATLYLYFKYWAMKGNNFLLIDEPEENLHPQSQMKLLNILMKFANRNNNRVLITTHSPLLAEAVNNHINISHLQEQGEDVAEIVKSHNLDIAISENLKSDDFAIYFFDGKSIKNYPINEYGAFFKNFREEEDKVRDTANILKDYIYNLSHKPA